MNTIATITLANHDDLPLILELQKLCYRSEADIYNDYSIAPLHQTLDDIRHEFTFMEFFKVEINGVLVGSVRAYKDNKTCNVGKLIVHPSHQNNGIGKQLLLHVEDAFSECSNFVLFTGFMSMKNLYIYNKLGYKEYDRQAISPQFTFVFLQKTREDRLANRNTAIIAGASGLVGTQLLNQILNDEYFTKVISIVRTQTDHTHPKLKQKVVDFNSLQHTMAGVVATHAFCCLGTTLSKAGSQAEQFKVDHNYVIEFALGCKNAGIDNLAVVSSIGANARSSNFYLRTKGQMEENIKQLMFSHLVIIRPSLLLGKRAEPRIGEKIGAIFNLLFSRFLGKYKGVEAGAVAHTMLDALKKQEKGTKIIESDKIVPLKTK